MELDAQGDAGTKPARVSSTNPEARVMDTDSQIIVAVNVTNVGTLEVLAMRIPSRVGGFNQDYYPPFVANEPSSKAEDWCAGTDVPAKTMQLTAEKKVQVKK